MHIPPPGYHSVNPYFVVDDVDSFIGFVTGAFDAIEVSEREMRPDGAIDHAEVAIGDSRIMISASSEKYPARPCVNFAYVNDVDAVFDRALARGARSIVPPAEQPWGDRVAGIVDPFDNRWWIATPPSQER